jgi:hypothetical protein
MFEELDLKIDDKSATMETASMASQFPFVCPTRILATCIQ